MSRRPDNMHHKPLLGCIADDVTGATDLALNLVQGGMRVVQLLDVPCAELMCRAKPYDAVVIALKSRSIPKQEAIAQSLASLRALEKLGIERFYFKYCSTFDSTELGNIGPVAEAFMAALGTQQTIFCPAFPRAGRTVYRGHLFVGDRLLCESGMEKHPLNPMTDANLVRFLSKQATQKVGLLTCDTVTAGVAAIRQRLKTLVDEGNSLVIADTCDDSHLVQLAEVAATMPLVTGGSGLARYLPAAYRAQAMIAACDFVPDMPAVSGRSLIIAGSCSSATNAQVAWMKNRCPTYLVDVAALLSDEATEIRKVHAWAAATEPTEPLLVTSSALPDEVGALQSRFGSERVAKSIERFLASVARLFASDFGVRRFVVAGGETSGAIVGSLGIRALQIGPEICTGVAWTQTIGIEPKLALALKSGNFGADNFFATALGMLA